MPADTPIVVAIAGEDRAHFEVVTTLTDRMVVTHRPWTDGNLEHLRHWLPDGDRPWFRLKDATRRARDLQLRFHGHFGGVAGRSDAQMARAQLALFF